MHPTGMHSCYLLTLHWISLTTNKDAKGTARYKLKLVVSELFHIAVNDFDAKKSVRYSRVLVVTELVVSGTQYSSPQVYEVTDVYLCFGIRKK